MPGEGEPRQVFVEVAKSLAAMPHSPSARRIARVRRVLDGAAGRAAPSRPVEPGSNIFGEDESRGRRCRDFAGEFADGGALMAAVMISPVSDL